MRNLQCHSDCCNHVTGVTVGVPTSFFSCHIQRFQAQFCPQLAAKEQTGLLLQGSIMSNQNKTMCFMVFLHGNNVT